MEIDIRPIPVDKLAAYQSQALQSRQARLEELVAEYTAKTEKLSADLEEARRIHTFVNRELENVQLAQQLAAGDIVRVVCPTCKGTGMKPADVMSGQVRSGTAFEGVGTPLSPKIDDRNKCKECDGKRWIIMPRFKG